MERRQERTQAWSKMLGGVLALLVLPLVIAPRAHAFVYWVDYADKSIGRANLDGTGVNEQFVTGIDPAVGVAVDARHIYWSDGGTIDSSSSIARAWLDGTKVDQAFIRNTGAEEIAVGGRHIYWTENIGAGGGFISASIARANLDGTGVERGFITGLDGYVYDLAVNDSHIYWDQVEFSGVGSIGRANLDGTGINERLIGVPAPGSITLGGEHVYWGYWGDSDPAWIGRAKLDGTGVEQDFIEADQALGITSDADQLYWIGQQGIGRANLDGSDVRSTFIAVPSRSGRRDVAVDGLIDTTAPKTMITKGVPDNTTRSELKFKFKSSEPNSSFECSLDKKPFRPCSSRKTFNDLQARKHRFRVRAIDAAFNVDRTPATDKFKIVG